MTVSLHINPISTRNPQSYSLTKAKFGLSLSKKKNGPRHLIPRVQLGRRSRVFRILRRKAWFDGGIPLATALASWFALSASGVKDFLFPTIFVSSLSTIAIKEIIVRCALPRRRVKH